MRGLSYKGYMIRPAPHRIADGRWAHEVYVARDRGCEIAMKPFSSLTTFRTREEATLHCVIFAREIIDGRRPNCSVDDL
jgi:hypothetical protein